MMLPKLQQVSDYQSWLENEFSANYHLIVRAEGEVFQIETNSGPLAKELLDYWGPLATEGKVENTEHTFIQVFQMGTVELDFPLTDRPHPEGRALKEQFYLFETGRGKLIKKTRTGVHFLMDEGINLAFGPVDENGNQVINFLNNRLLEKYLMKGRLLMHSSGIVINGKGVAMSGRSGGGKSTLALTCIERGAKFLSNDRVLFEKTDSGGRMRGIPKHPRVNPGTLLQFERLKGIMDDERLEKYSSMAKEELWPIEDKFDVVMHKTYGPQSMIWESSCEFFVILDWNYKSSDPLKCRLTTVGEEPDVLAAIEKDEGLFFNGKKKTHQDYLDGMKEMRCLVLEGGVDMEAAASVIEGLLDRWS